ncbi:unnamed protein product [Schistocephalus solidus]|uniref:Late endosomal/lysosomal adaptor and MAPK and MTOR activator 5 n=1 Tax=Schistocephalus solidus TaxID=70667 RepID=A0A183TN59_SCHSO|nr:unnamed protein product [Schistocephalus solidus]
MKRKTPVSTKIIKSFLEDYILFPGAARTWGTQPRQPPASSPASGVVARPGAAPAAPATCALSHLRQVWWYAQGRFRPRQPPAPSPISGLLDSVLTPGSGGGGGESAVAAALGYYHLKLIHAQVTVSAPTGVEHTVDLVEIDGRTVYKPSSASHTQRDLGSTVRALDF